MPKMELDNKTVAIRSTIFGVVTGMVVVAALVLGITLGVSGCASSSSDDECLNNECEIENTESSSSSSSSTDSSSGGASSKSSSVEETPSVHTHEWNTYYSYTDGTNHYIACSGCEEIKDEEAHNLIDTYTDGVHHKMCDVCGFIATSLAHEFDSGITSYRASDSTTKYSCDCGYYISIDSTISLEEIDSDEHNWSEWLVTSEPTCTTSGTKERTCSICDAIEVTDIAPLGHTYLDHALYQKSEESHYRYCEVCHSKVGETSHEYGSEYYVGGSGHYQICEVCEYQSSEFDHDYTLLNTLNAATCQEDGRGIYICRECLTRVEDVIPATGHYPSTEWLYTDSSGHYHVCLSCGEPILETKVNHNFNTYSEISSYETSHNVICSDCGYSYTDNHNFDDGVVTTEAGCETYGIKTYTCADCGATRSITIDPVGHNPASMYSSDSDGHYYECLNGCGEKLNYETHSLGEYINHGDGESGVHYKQCSVCTYKTEEENHNFDYESGEITIKATCESDGLVTYHCKDCNAVKTETIPATGHNKSLTLSYDNDGHYYECLNGCGEKLEYTLHSLGEYISDGNGEGATHHRECSECAYVEASTTHNWSEGTETSSPSCIMTGTLTYYCTDEGCEATKTEVIPALGHTYDETKFEYDSEGLTHYNVCSVCEAHLNIEGHALSDYIPNGDGESGTHYQECEICDYVTDNSTHNWDSGEITVPAECLKEGEMTYTCLDCGATKTETITALEHIPASTYSYDNDGHWYECLNGCGEKLSYEDHTMSGNTSHGDGESGTHTNSCVICGYIECDDEHTWDEDDVSITIEATCESDGLLTYHCTDCNATKTEIIPALGHDYAAEWSSDDSGHYHECVRCGKHDEVIAHDLGDYLNDETNNTHYRVCNVCNYKVTASGHNWDNGETLTPATCTEAGTMLYTCSDCEATKTEVIPMTGHNIDYSSGYKYNDEGHYYECLNGCGEKLEYQEHVTSLVSDGNDIESTHHSKCLICEYESSGEEHNWDEGITTVEATCTSAGLMTYTCIDCGETYTEDIAMIPHSYSSILTYDETGHYYECIYGCGARTGFETHDSYLGEYISKGDGDSGTHYQVCSECGYMTNGETHNWSIDNSVISIEPGCETPGLRTYTCSDCEATKTEIISATGHDYSEEWSSNEYGHYHECLVCGQPDEVISHENYLGEYISSGDGEDGSHYKECSECGYQTNGESHVWGESEVSIEATCEGSGLLAYTCSECGATKVEIIDPIGHDWDSEYTSDVTGHYKVCLNGCGQITDFSEHNLTYVMDSDGEDGSHHEYCSDCGYMTEAESHHWSKGSVTTSETCTEEGEMTYTCTDGCGATYTESIAPHGHTTDTSHYEYDEDGHYYVCSECGEMVEETYVAHEAGDYVSDGNSASSTHHNSCTHCGTTLESEEHSWDEGVVSKEATCTEDGVMTYTCSVCGETRTEVIPMTGHTTDTSHYEYDDNGHYYVCSECGAKLDETYESHTSSLGDYISSGDGEGGSHYKVCSKCGYKTDGEVHNFTMYEVTIEPTCTTQGLKTYTCSDCGATKTEVIEATGHNPDYSSGYKYDSDGHYYECLNGCGTKLEYESHDSYLSDYISSGDGSILGNNYHYKVCSVCGYTTTGEAHNLKWCYDDYSHYYECTDCDAIFDKGSHTVIGSYARYNENVANFSCPTCGWSYDTEVNFASDSWELISRLSSDGVASLYYKVGETKDIVLSDGEDYEETITVRIIDFNHDELTTFDWSYNDHTHAGITLEMVDCLNTKHSMSKANTNTNSGGWNDSRLRATLNSDSAGSIYNDTGIYYTLPSDLKDVIKSVNKVASNGDGSTSVTTSSDKLFLLSLAEIYSSSSGGFSSSSYTSTYAKEGTQYAYYADTIGSTSYSDNCSSLVKNVRGSANTWSLRSPAVGSTSSFEYINSSGSNGYWWSSTSYGVSFAFCI